jgi:hypothetical protein
MNHIRTNKNLIQVRHVVERLVGPETVFCQLLQRRDKSPPLYQFCVLAYLLVLLWDHRTNLLSFLTNKWVPASAAEHRLSEDRIPGTLLDYLWRLISSESHELMESPSRIWLVARLLRVRSMLDDDTKAKLQDELFYLLCMKAEASNLYLLKLRKTVIDGLRAQQGQRVVEERPIEEMS